MRLPPPSSLFSFRPGIPLLLAAAWLTPLLPSGAEVLANRPPLDLKWLVVRGISQPAVQGQAAEELVLGGNSGGSILFVTNLPLLERIAQKPSDIVKAEPLVTLLPGRTSAADTLQASLYLVALGTDGESIDPQGERRLVGAVALSAADSEGRLKLPDIAGELQKELGTPQAPSGFLLVLGNGAPGAASVTIANAPAQVPRLRVEMPPYQRAQLFHPAVVPQPGVYTRVQDGHLFYGGERLRLWGVVGDPDVQRLLDLGFNAERIWGPGAEAAYTPESAQRGEFAPHSKGDGSKFDAMERHIAELKEKGLFIMFAALNDTIPAKFLLGDDSFVEKGDDWEAWKAAEMAPEKGDQNGYLYVDQRLQEIKKRHARNLLTHVNPYTGKAYGEEEAIAVYEVFNENGFVHKTFSNGLDNWNPFFLHELQVRWNDWLRRKYIDDAGLVKAWGALKPGESLEGSTLAPAPCLGQRADYPEARATDFIRFLTELADSFHQDFRAYCRALFPAGIGVNGAPFSFDTQFRSDLAWSYGQSLGDVNSFGMYFWNLDSSLSRPPAGYVIDSSTVENKPSILYETNIGRPDPFRSEYPLKLAAMASYQDWDGVFWHYWGPAGKNDGPEDLGYLTGILLPPTAEHYWTAVHHELDPVMNASMLLAGQIFQRGLLPPAAKPDIFEIGAKALFSPDTVKGVNAAASTFGNGSRLRFVPGADSGITVNGGPLPVPGRIEKAIASGPFIKWDWPQERLIIDSPSVKAYVGKIDGPFRFADGITLGEVSTPWICFAMVDEDGKPLAGPGPSGCILMNGVFDARNTGFQFNYQIQGGPVEEAHAVANIGREPVVVTPVGYSVWFPTRIEGALQSYDFALRETRNEALSATNKVVQKGPTPLIDVLTIEKRGEIAPLPVDRATEIPIQEPAGTTTETGAPMMPLSSFPLMPELPWDLGYVDAYRTLRRSTYTLTHLSSEDTGQGPRKQIQISGFQLPSLWSDAADVTMTFEADKVAEVDLTFVQPPALSQIVDDFTQKLGLPSENHIEAQYGNTRVHWTRATRPRDVLVTESQGTLKILVRP